MNDDHEVRDPQLARASGRFGRSGRSFLALSAIAAVPGIVLVVLGHTWLLAVGLALIAIACSPMIIAAGLLISSAVAHRAARRRPFA